MSEYQLLNPGPLIKLHATGAASDQFQPNADPSASSSTNTGTGSPVRRVTSYPPRQSYILGFEPTKQVYLVPFYDKKVHWRADLGLVIAPGLKHWDFIRGFKVVWKDMVENSEFEKGSEFAAMELEEKASYTRP
jgi:hypothetical protein